MQFYQVKYFILNSCSSLFPDMVKSQHNYVHSILLLFYKSLMTYQI